LEARHYSASEQGQNFVDQRSQPRFKIEVDLMVTSHTCGRLKGHTVDMSESGLSAMLNIEVPLGEVVELNFTLPLGPVAIYAMVREKNAFRYGFQFVASNCVREVIKPTCLQLATKKTLFGGI
jgi:predicted transport protein